MTDQKPDTRAIFNHIKESSIEDPLYITKIIFGAVGKNMIDIVIRIAIYIIVVYPLLTVVLQVPQGVAALLVVVGIVLYHSSIAIYRRIAKEATETGANKVGQPHEAAQTIIDEKIQKVV
jgi:hypothetical protein